MGEVLLVYKGVRYRRVRYAVRRFSNLDERSGQTSAASQVRKEARPELFQGFLKKFFYRV